MGARIGVWVRRANGEIELLGTVDAIRASGIEIGEQSLPIIPLAPSNSGYCAFSTGDWIADSNRLPAHYLVGDGAIRLIAEVGQPVSRGSSLVFEDLGSSATNRTDRRIGPGLVANEDGTVLFWGKAGDGTTSVEALWVADMTETRMLFPLEHNAEATSYHLGHPDLSIGGFTRSPAGEIPVISEDDKLFIWNPETSVLERIHIPSETGLNAQNVSRINAFGQVADAHTGDSLWIASLDGVQRLVAAGEAAPGTDGQSFIRITWPALNDNYVFFRGLYDETWRAQPGLFRLKTDGTRLTKLALPGDPITNAPDLTFAWALSYTVTPAERGAAIWAFCEDAAGQGVQALLYADGDRIELIAREGMVIGENMIKDFGSAGRVPMLSPDGVVASMFAYEGERGAGESLVLTSGFRLSGRLLSGLNGYRTGVPDGVVTAFQYDESNQAFIQEITSVADARGFYDFGYLSDGYYRLRADSPTHQWQIWPWSTARRIYLGNGLGKKKNFYLLPNPFGTSAVISIGIREEASGNSLLGVNVTASWGAHVIETVNASIEGMNVRIPEEDLPAEGNDVLLQFSATGYQDWQTVIRVLPRGRYSVDALLVRDGEWESGGIVGRIVNHSTSDGLNATVVVTDPATGVGRATSSRLGDYALEGIPGGLARVTVSTWGFASQTRLVDIVANETLQLDFEMFLDDNGELGDIAVGFDPDAPGQAMRLSWLLHWIDPILECSPDLATWSPVKGVVGNAHTLPAGGETKYLRVRYDP
ncbi:MAG: carboxypeptidase regulatory-like domain-containing protein [Verrucomicrobiae bacterium]|nr:carboxypeptidase regulatory-like domain-containing protein [Verrucomicrobiae bacterium]